MLNLKFRKQVFSDKKNILQLVALLKAHGVRNIVCCPGSRNTPIIQALCEEEFFQCHAITDERSGAFFALGLALHGGKPAAICCTSGSALLNIHPAVAEAFYQQVPLVVISADRPTAWIGQMDGQTLPQPGVFGSLVKRTVQLPEIHTEEEEWYANRLINEALLALHHHGKGPVHINVPIAEPLFQFTTEKLPEVRVITRYQGLNVYDRQYDELIARLNGYSKRMVIAGQMSLIYLFEKKICKLLYKHFTWLAEHIGNRIVPGLPIKNFDALLYALSEAEQETAEAGVGDHLWWTYRFQTVKELPAEPSTQGALARFARRRGGRYLWLPNHRHRDGSLRVLGEDRLPVGESPGGVSKRLGISFEADTRAPV